MKIVFKKRRYYYIDNKKYEFTKFNKYCVVKKAYEISYYEFNYLSEHFYIMYIKWKYLKKHVEPVIYHFVKIKKHGFCEYSYNNIVLKGILYQNSYSYPETLLLLAFKNKWK